MQVHVIPRSHMPVKEERNRRLRKTSTFRTQGVLIIDGRGIQALKMLRGRHLSDVLWLSGRLDPVEALLRAKDGRAVERINVFLHACISRARQVHT